MPGPPLQSLRLFTLPGWQGSAADHWQSHWERDHGCTRVEQDDWTWPRRGDWMARLDEVILQSDTPALLIAHSLGCHLVAAWAAHSRHAARVQGALLVAFPDTERADMPPNIFNWAPMVLERIPFPTLAAVSGNDPYCTAERAEHIARAWGSILVDVGHKGHVNVESGLGDWPEGWRLLRGLPQRSPTIQAW